MARAKSKATIMVADGAGGMVAVQDRRFEPPRDWPIHFEVPKDQAENWLRYFYGECARRGWNSSGIGQMDARENTGSITVNAGGSGQQLAVVWERKRDGPIKVRARTSGAPEFPLDEANELFRQVNERSRAAVTEEFHRGWQLCYEGLPWKGELWLSDKLRLGPPSKQDESALLGPRIILVNALVNGIDALHAGSTFDVTLRELSVFLSVVMGRNVAVYVIGRLGWTWNTDSSGQVAQCDIRNLGYWEEHWPAEMPAKGVIPCVPLQPVRRPDFSLRGIDGTKTELHLPQDIEDLWQAFMNLPPELRRQFLQVGSMWQLALSLGQEHQTARFAWMVAACEGLKPLDDEYRNHNAYQVVESLLGKPTADTLQQETMRPQEIRNAYLHRGELRGSEFALHVMNSSFQDPTFGQALRAMHQVT